MKKDDLIIVIIGLLLLAGMLYTIFFGGDKSRHGVGEIYNLLPEHEKITFYYPDFTDNILIT